MSMQALLALLQGMLVLCATRGGAAWEFSSSGKPTTALLTVLAASSGSRARAGAAGGSAVGWARVINKILPRTTLQYSHT